MATKPKTIMERVEEIFLGEPPATNVPRPKAGKRPTAKVKKATVKAKKKSKPASKTKAKARKKKSKRK